jgi:hypothetical protein
MNENRQRLQSLNEDSYRIAYKQIQKLSDCPYFNKTSLKLNQQLPNR